jgi:hypothetical protein
MSLREKRNPPYLSPLYHQDEREGLASIVFEKEEDRDTHSLPPPHPSSEGFSGIGISKERSPHNEPMVSKDSVPSFLPGDKGR